MTEPRIALFARVGDPTTTRVADALQHEGIPFAWWSLSERSATFRLSSRGGVPSLDGTALGTVSAYWLRHCPAESALLRPAGTTLTSDAWWQLAMEQKDRVHVARSVLYALDAMGARGVNAHARAAPFDLKPHQLWAFGRAGLPIPATCIPGDEDELSHFRAATKSLIVKPAAGGAPARWVDDEVIASWRAHGAPPAIFQQHAPGVDVRAIVVDGAVVSAMEIESESLDVRATEAYRLGQVPLRSHRLSAVGRAVCLAAARLCEHVVSGIDLKLHEGQYTLLEANSAPVWAEQEEKTGDPIARAVVRALLRRR